MRSAIGIGAGFDGAAKIFPPGLQQVFGSLETGKKQSRFPREFSFDEELQVFSIRELRQREFFTED